MSVSRLLTPLIIALLAAGVARAGPYEDAQAARARGDYAAALKIWRPAADRGDPSAQNGLGILYANGEGVPQDYALALEYFQLSAAQGFGRADFNLGYSYEVGEGVSQDAAEAIRYYRLAAWKGIGKAKVRLGTIYLDGRIVPRDDAEARIWFIAAAEQISVDAQSDPEAQFQAAELYSRAGGDQCLAKARLYYRQAAMQDHQGAQNGLGYMYADLGSVSRDDVIAYAWFSLAAEGDETLDQRAARNNLDWLGRRMTPQQIAEAKQKAVQCRQTAFKVCPGS